MTASSEIVAEDAARSDEILYLPAIGRRNVFISAYQTYVWWCKVYPHFWTTHSGPCFKVCHRTLKSSRHFVKQTRSGELLCSTSSLDATDKEGILKSGPIRSAAVDSTRQHLATIADDKTLKVWDVDGLKLLSERFAFHAKTRALLHVTSLKLIESYQRSLRNWHSRGTVKRFLSQINLVMSSGE